MKNNPTTRSTYLSRFPITILAITLTVFSAFFLMQISALDKEGEVLVVSGYASLLPVKLPVAVKTSSRIKGDTTPWT